MKRLLIACCFICVVASPVAAQLTSDTARLKSLDSQNEQEKKQEPKSGEQKKAAGVPGSDATRINLLTGQGDVSEANYQPLTGKQRVQLWLNGSFTTPGAYVGSIANSLIDQASGSPREWGGGMEGYARRLGSRVATNAVQGAIQASAAAAFRLDPRYIRSSSRLLSHRISHALLFVVITLNDDGRRRINFANLASFYGSAAVASTWVPRTESTLRYTAKDGSRQIVFSGLNNILQEFWPEIRKAIKRR